MYKHHILLCFCLCFKCKYRFLQFNYSMKMLIHNKKNQYDLYVNMFISKWKICKKKKKKLLIHMIQVYKQVWKFKPMYFMRMFSLQHAVGCGFSDLKMMHYGNHNNVSLQQILNFTFANVNTQFTVCFLSYICVLCRKH